MKKNRKGKNFIKQAYYKGGSKALETFILNHLQYPQEAFDKSIEGTIHAKYDINQRGKVTKIKLYNSIGYGCDEEAKRVIRLLQFVVPKTRGLHLTYHKEIHIHFRMPKSKPIEVTKDDKIENTTTTPQTLQYNIVETPKKEATDKKNNSGESYHYTISM
ncbi:MAG: energy transducer TonB [Saprospiraceae bacterium]